MSAYLKSQGCSLVGFERSMWCATIAGHTLLIAAHIDDLVHPCLCRSRHVRCIPNRTFGPF
jgi:hypothetical protein